MTDDQAGTLRRMRPTHLVPVDMPKQRLIAVTGGKGGVGKSTIAVNLAAHYAQRGSKTLALDGDLGMADLNLLLGLAPARTLLDVLQGFPIAEVLVESSGIQLLPGLNGSYALANLTHESRTALFESIDTILDRFDTMIVDTPAGISEHAMALAGGAADVVVVATPEPLSLADAYACLKVLSIRQKLTRAFVLPNNVRSPAEADEVFDRLSSLVERFLGIDLTPLPAVPHDPAVAIAAAAGVPLVLHSPDSRASRAIRQAARRIDAVVQGDTSRDRLRLSRRSVATAGGGAP